MSRTAVLQDSYALGERSDSPRVRIPKAGAYRVYDFIPQSIGARLRKRGGWRTPHSGVMAGTSMLNVTYWGFPSGAQIVAQSATGQVYRVVDGGGLTEIGPGPGTEPGGGSTNPVARKSRRPAIWRDNIVFFDRTQNPCYYDGSGWHTMVAPHGDMGATWREYFVIPIGTRLFFSPPGDPFSTWDTTNSYIDAPQAIYAVAPMRTSILAFGRSRTHRFRGTTPPSQYSLGDMVSEPLWPLGCADMRSIVYHGDQLIFANAQGIWLTDGTTLENLAEGGGILRSWLSQLAGYEPTSWIIACGLMGGLLFVSVYNASGPVAGWMCNLERRSWVRTRNIYSSSFATNSDAGEEMYFGRFDSARLGALGSIMHPDASNMADGDGDPVLPSIETANFQDRPGFKRWIELFVNYELEGSATTLDVGFAVDPFAQSSYVPLGSLEPIPVRGKRSLPIRHDGEGVQFRIAQTGPSANTIIYELEAALYPQEQSRIR